MGIKQLKPFRGLKTDPEKYKIPGISRGQEPEETGRKWRSQSLRRKMGRAGNTKVKERVGFRKKGGVNCVRCCSGVG